MEKYEIYNRIENYAVRIGSNDENKTLKGSGTLFPVLAGEKMYVLTAAHVITPLKEKMETEGQTICLICKESANNLHEIIVDNPKNIFIHSKYKNENKNQEYFYDIAIIQIPWEPWMDMLNGYQLKEGKIGIELSGYGFPEALDNEKNTSNATLFSGISQFCGSVESSDVGRLAVRYNFDVSSDISRDSIMIGYSGTGLLCMENQSIYLRGIISCSRGKEAAGFTLWAMDAKLILELMEESNIEIGYPASFHQYKDMVAEDFDSFKKICIRNWKENADKVLEGNTIVPELFERQVKSVLPCEGNRKLCSDFWKEKLRELVMMYEVQKIPKEQLGRPKVNLPPPYTDDKVSLEFFCTELKAESILGKMIENHQFAEEGEYYNNMIMLINGKAGHRNRDVKYTRRDCRNIMGNIAGEYETCTTNEISRMASHLLSEEQKNINFDIIKGSMVNCNIAAIGTNKLMDDIFNEEMADDRKEIMDKILGELWGKC